MTEPSRSFSLDPNAPKDQSDVQQGPWHVPAGSGGGPPQGGDRLAKLELEVAKLAGGFDAAKSVVAILFGVILGGFTLVYNHVSTTRETVNSRLDLVERRIAEVEQAIRSLPDRVADQLDRAVRLTLDAYRAGQTDRPVVPPAPVPAAPPPPPSGR
jgi:hypothetical protein